MIFNLKDVDMNNYISWVYSELLGRIQTAENNISDNSDDIYRINGFVGFDGQLMYSVNLPNTSINSLMGESVTSYERKLLKYYNNCGLNGKSLILLTAKYKALTAKNERESKLRHTILCLVPIYCKGDIILIANRFPENDEHGVFYGNGKAYIRQFIEESNGYILKSLHNQSEDIVFNRMNKIEYIGTCCDVVRT